MKVTRYVSDNALKEIRGDAGGSLGIQRAFTTKKGGCWDNKIIIELPDENMITIDGKEYSESTIHKALKEYVGGE